YLEDLNIDILTLLKVDFNIQYVIEKILANTPLKEIDLDVNNLSDYLCKVIFLYWKKAEVRQNLIPEEKINKIVQKFGRSDILNVNKFNDFLIGEFVLK